MSPLVVALLVVGGIVVLVGGAILVVVALVVVGAQAATDPATGITDGGAWVEQGVSSASSEERAVEPSMRAEEPEADDPKDVAPVAAGGSGKAGSKGKPGTTGGSWSCMASASVRVCGFAGACNYQMVFGNGYGPDRSGALLQAKSNCEASARAKGASTVCVAQCSAR